MTFDPFDNNPWTVALGEAFTVYSDMGDQDFCLSILTELATAKNQILHLESCLFAKQEEVK